MKCYLLTLTLILEPYKSINYSEPNLYIIGESHEKLEIVEVLGEGYPKKTDVNNMTPWEMKDYFMRSIYSGLK